MSSARYLMESEEEARRLEAKTDARLTRRLLRLAGLPRNAKALDAGAGTGAVARVMAERVGPGGRVIAVDFSASRCGVARRLALEAGLLNLAVLPGDLYRLPLATGSLDFVWCRFVVEYLADPSAVIGELTRVLRRGGKLVVGDLDGNGFFHDPLPAELEASLLKLERALKGRFDPWAGRKLFRLLRGARLEAIRVRAMPYHLHAGRPSDRDLENWRQKLQALAEPGAAALGGKPAWTRFEKSFLGFLESEDTLTYSTLFLVEGMKP